MEVVQVTFDLEVPNGKNDGMIEEIRLMLEAKGYSVLGSDRTTMTEEYKKMGWKPDGEIEGEDDEPELKEDLWKLKDYLELYIAYRHPEYNHIEVGEIGKLELNGGSYQVGYTCTEEGDSLEPPYMYIQISELEEFVKSRNPS
jgi:hypothetical protein